MLSILDRYIGKTLLGMVLLVLLVLLSIFVFVALVDELNDTGRGNYGVIQAIQYVALITPRLIYSLLPVIAVIAAMATLGILANSSELVVIRTAGVSQYRLALAFIKPGLLLVLLGFVIGESIVAVTEQKAKYLRSVALKSQITLKTQDGFWSRDGNSFINIKTILPGDKVKDIHIYEFDDHRLRTSVYAQTAEYTDGKWILYDIKKTRLGQNRVESWAIKSATWEAILNPEIINLIIIRPRYLSIWRLINHIDYLQSNNQNSALYQQALWSKIIHPFSILIMLLLAFAFVKISARGTSVGQRVFIGALVGIVYHVMTQISGSLGIVYGVPPFISIALPPALFAGFILFRLSRAT